MEVIKNEGVFRTFDRHTDLVLTDEAQLDRIIAGADVPLFEDGESSFNYAGGQDGTVEIEVQTLNSQCRRAAEDGETRLEVSYDFFFGDAAKTKRTAYPSDQITVDAFKSICDAAAAHGMSFGASVISPLDVGGGWAKISDETGFSYQYQEAAIAPDGSYSADMVCQRRWCNNKGPIELVPCKVLAYAFNEERVGDTCYFHVDETAIVDISDTALYTIDVEKTEITGEGYGYCPMRIYGMWETPAANRVLCIMVYRTPELDYFAPSAGAFMKQVLDMHASAGIRYEAFYSDEMHIQFDWDLNAHFGESEINARYLTPHLADRYAALYGEKYRDFAKYLIYMSYHQHDFLPGAEGREPAQHVFAPTTQGIYDTWIFRNRYFELLGRTVVDLANDAKAYAESLWGGPIMTRAHASWQESPTCDHYYKKARSHGFDLTELLPEQYATIKKDAPPEQRAALRKAEALKAQEMGVTRYEYTPWYDWSSSIRENMAGCYDYFKWNEFLTAGGADHAEGGNLDRDYFSQAMAVSYSVLNPFELGYNVAWGMPIRIRDNYFQWVNRAYGVFNWYDETLSFVNGLGTRRTDVLALYPIKLNNVEERFGSWMVQYGYCNYITEEKLLQYADVNSDGTLSVGDQCYRCIVALFEPFLDEKTFDLLERFLAAGGKVLWCSIPALTDNTGMDTARRFMQMFGLAAVQPGSHPVYCKGKSVQFEGRLSGVKAMPILNDYLVDGVYPCTPVKADAAAASVGDKTVAVTKNYPNGGLAVYAGFRLRDDQSCSLGQDVDTLFRVLCAMGAYREGSLEVRSRKTESPYLFNTFADGSLACAPHYRSIWEAWDVGFVRDPAYDAAFLAGRQLPGEGITLQENLQGHDIIYTGQQFLAYRLNEAGAPVAFYGIETDGITVDGKKYIFADRQAKFEFAPVPERFLAEGIARAVMTTCWTPGTVITIPVSAEKAPAVAACHTRLFNADMPVAYSWDGNTFTYTVTEELVGKRVLLYW